MFNDLGLSDTPPPGTILSVWEATQWLFIITKQKKAWKNSGLNPIRQEIEPGFPPISEVDIAWDND